MHYWNKFYEILNCIWYIRRCLKLDCFTSTKRPPDFARLINNFIIIYHNYSGMTVKTVYIPIILVHNILWHYFDPAIFSSKLLNQQQPIWCKQWGQIDNSETVTSAIKLNLINLTPKNRIHFSPIMFLLLCTQWTVYKLLNLISV